MASGHVWTHLELAVFQEQQLILVGGCRPCLLEFRDRVRPAADGAPLNSLRPKAEFCLNFEALTDRVDTVSLKRRI